MVTLVGTPREQSYLIVFAEERRGARLEALQRGRIESHTHARVLWNVRGFETAVNGPLSERAGVTVSRLPWPSRPRGSGARFRSLRSAARCVLKRCRAELAVPGRGL